LFAFVCSEVIGFEIEPAERRFHDAYLAEFRAALSEAAFFEAYEQERKIKLEEAVKLCFE
jgi:hypothetical protein